MSEWLSQFFRELPDGAKFATVWILIGVLAVQISWSIYSWFQAGQIRREMKLLRRELAQAREDRDQLESRFTDLDKVDDHVWKRGFEPTARAFVPREQRKTRFVAVCNLKGGVGKTTSVVNLGGLLAQNGKRVLFVDLDFQGTLSNYLLAPELVTQYREKAWTTDRLLRSETSIDDVRTLIFPTSCLPNADIMIARERLELEEFIQQTRFFIDPTKEARFHFCRLFHQPTILGSYDLVIFDCPPRMSTACVNALASSDSLLLPTGLSQVDIEAVPRTLGWMQVLRQVVAAEVCGVLISRCEKLKGTLVSADAEQLRKLEEQLSRNFPGRGMVFQAMIKDSRDIFRHTAERKPVILTEGPDRAVFEVAATEFLQRVGLA